MPFYGLKGSEDYIHLPRPNEYQQQIEYPAIAATFLDDGEPFDYDGITYFLGFAVSMLLIVWGLNRASDGARVVGFGLIGTGLLLDVLTCVGGMLDCLPWRGCL